MFSFLNAFDAPVLYKERTVSTMEDARSLVASGCLHGTVTAAGYQEAGRGRFRERRWEAEAGKNLLLSIVLRKELLPSQGALLSLTAGLAVSDTLEGLYGVETRIKWPNDMWWEEKKVSGILCEGVGSYLIAGIGINGNQGSFPDTLTGRAVSVAGITGKPVEIELLAEKLISRLNVLIQADNVIPLVDERLLFRGQEVTVATGSGDNGGRVCGVCRGIGDQGELVLQHPDTGEAIHLFGGELEVC